MPIILLAVGGSHGDFLFSCCRLMLNQSVFSTNTAGKVSAPSEWKTFTLLSYKEGKKLSYITEPTNKIEMSHIWYEEFAKMPNRFYCIDYNDKQIEVIKKMSFIKNYKDVNALCEQFKEILPKSLAGKINENNIDNILTISYKNMLKKFKKQPNINLIKITDLYSFKSLVKILKNMNLYNKSQLTNLKNYHKEWKEKNLKYYKELVELETK